MLYPYAKWENQETEWMVLFYWWGKCWFTVVEQTQTFYCIEDEILCLLLRGAINLCNAISASIDDPMIQLDFFPFLFDNFNAFYSAFFSKRSFNYSISAFISTIQNAFQYVWDKTNSSKTLKVPGIRLRWWKSKRNQWCRLRTQKIGYMLEDFHLSS